ncbi:MAG: tetratricopeptide repeat protein [Phycisphaerae bacterium]|nr:tetratricopeptide repeat protein [Phycisphaerae bacterium]
MPRDINPDSAEAYCQMGIGYGKRGQYDKAIAAYHNAIEINSDDAEPYHRMGVFPELYPYLQDAFEQAEPGEVYCCPQYVNASQMYRKTILDVIKQAGLTPWAKIFQNCRATRETELAETYPAHVACKWIGNSLRVANEHYLQVTEDHFKKAVHFPVQYDAAERGIGLHSNTQRGENPIKKAPNECGEPQLVGPVGFEPTTKKL